MTTDEDDAFLNGRKLVESSGDSRSKVGSTVDRTDSWVVRLEGIVEYHPSLDRTVTVDGWLGWSVVLPSVDGVCSSGGCGLER